MAYGQKVVYAVRTSVVYSTVALPHALAPATRAAEAAIKAEERILFDIRDLLIVVMD